MSDARAPLEYLLSCSDPALESIHLSRLDRAAALRKEMRDVLEEWVQAEVDARIARWILKNRRGESHETGSVPKGLVSLPSKSPNQSRLMHRLLHKSPAVKRLAICVRSPRSASLVMATLEPRSAAMISKTVPLRSRPNGKQELNRSHLLRLPPESTKKTFVVVCRTLARALAAGTDNSANGRELVDEELPVLTIHSSTSPAVAASPSLCTAPLFGI